MLRTITLAAIATSSFIHAEEHTVKEQPFHTETTLNAVFLPTTSTAISIKPEAWSDFTITNLIPQGTQVKKGDTLIGIDTEALDKHIAETEKSIITSELRLAQTQHELAQLKITTPRELAKHARAEKQAAENLAQYEKIGHPQEIEQTKRSVKNAEDRLAYQKEELKQLLKMYSEDNKTEETEEIILKRTRQAVDRAEFALKVARTDADWTLNTTIPRKLESIKRNAKSTSIANAAAKEELPRALNLKQIAADKATKEHLKKTEHLSKLKADRAMMNITAPADGIVYYGSMDKGRWNPAGAVKVLKVGGRLPANMTLLTFIPNQTSLNLTAFAAAKDLVNLTTDSKGHAITSLNRYQSIPVTINNLATYPGTDGSYRIDLTPNITKDTHVVPGMKATIKIHGQQVEKALTVPASYLKRQPDGSYTVKLKLADGKTEDRKVTISQSSQDTVVITQGLEKGQVIVK